MNALLRPLMIYAAVGLVLSLATHILSLAGIRLGGMGLFIGLHVGIFPLWLVVVLISRKLTAGALPKDYWRVALSGCPAWVKYMTYGFLIYAVLNFAIFIVTAPAGKAVGASPPSDVWRGFSGHWMFFYSVGLAIVTTAHRRGLSNLTPKCPNGHAIGFQDSFCPKCGVAVTTQGG
jgi:hypothetical protein